MKFCVIGLGHFGQNLALSLARMGAEVMALDVKEENVSAVQDDVSYAATLNAADPSSLKMLPLHDMDAVIVAIGDNFEDSLLTTAYLQELGVKRVITRVINPVHEKLLRLMKVQDLVLPEEIAAARMAKTLIHSRLLSTYELARGYGISEVKCPQKLFGKTLLEASIREKYKLNLVTIKRVKDAEDDDVSRIDTSPEAEIVGVIEPSYVFGEDDVLVLFGSDNDIRHFVET